MRKAKPDRAVATRNGHHRYGETGIVGRRSQVAALIVVGIIVVALLWVAQAIVAHNTLQNCIDSGRRTCLDVGNDNASAQP